MTGHGLALVLVGETLVGVAHVLRDVLQGKGLLPSGGLLLTAETVATDQLFLTASRSESRMPALALWLGG